MPYQDRLLFFLLIVVLNTSCASSKNIAVVKPSASRIKTEGRIAIDKNGVGEIYWPGSGFAVKFKGTEIKAVLEDERGFNYFNIVVDDSLTGNILISKSKATYTLASNLKDTIHSVKLLKRADWFRGKTKLHEFQFSTGSTLFREKPKKRKIEFFGNSITVGAAVEDLEKDRGDGPFTNNYRSYSSITAGHFNAEFSCIASSGIGLMASAGNLIMPDIYDRLNPDDSTSKWHFPGKHPDIVVINLFQNDSWIVRSPDFEQFKKRFGTQAPSDAFIVNAYKNFVHSIRSHYPNAHIICTLGSMDAVKSGSAWIDYIKKAVAEINDKKVYTYFFEFTSPKMHPKIKEQQKMADELIDFISKNISW